MNVKMTFTIPEDVAEDLKRTVGHSLRSAFVTNAVKEKLRSISQGDLEKELIQGYKERYEEDKALNEEWESVTLNSRTN